MANVILSTFTNLPYGILDSFRQGLVDALVREGNKVLLFKTNGFLEDYNANNTLKINIDKYRLIEAINDFKPDLFISINHSGLFNDLSDSLECPIGIWLVDGPSYLIEQDECRRKADRYHMYIATPAFRNDLRQSFGIKNNRIHDLPFASDFRPYASQPIHNISFIGTNFQGQGLLAIIKNYGHDRNYISKFRDLINSYQDDTDTVFTERIKKYGLENIFVGNFDEAYILNIISINRRIKVLDAIEELGLALYGTADWPNTIQYSVGLALSFNPYQILTKSDAESIYNASKISLNISHSQARGGLSWRIFDVMSCNSALVSDYQKDLHHLFGKDKDIDIPVYTNPFEARTICKRLLNDEKHRQFIVESCNNVIETGHRFKHRLKTISEITDVNLLPEGEGKFTQLDNEDFQQPQNTSTLDRQFVTNIHNTNCSIKQFSLQLFQSNSLDFISDNSILININIPTNKLINEEFEIFKSMPFLRLDIGEYFSQHTNVKITISLVSESSQNNPNIYVVDLAKDIIQSNQFFWHNNNLSCGFDSFFVFENPFPQKNIKLHFASILQTEL